MTDGQLKADAADYWDALDTRARNVILKGVVKAIVKDEVRGLIKPLINEHLEASVRVALVTMLTSRDDIERQVMAKIKREAWRFKVNVTVDGIDRDDDHGDESVRW